VLKKLAVTLGLLLCAGIVGAQDFIRYTTGNTFTAPVLFPDGSIAAPGIAFSAQPTTGIFRSGAGTMDFDYGGTTGMRETATSLQLPSASGIYFLSGIVGTSSDATLVRDGVGILAIKAGVTDQFFRLYGANGGYWERGVSSELLTIAAAASTDTTGNLLPANAIIEAVTVRVITVIPTAATFTVGDAATPARFATGVAVAADTTAVGLLQRNPADADAAGPVQASAAKVRITPNLQPGAATGVIRISVFYSRFVPPTS
jgi:hypothetical protein